MSLTESSDEETSSGDVRGRESSGRRYVRHDREWRHERDMPRDRDHWDRRHSDYRHVGGRGGYHHRRNSQNSKKRRGNYNYYHWK